MVSVFHVVDLAVSIGADVTIVLLLLLMLNTVLDEASLFSEC